MALVAVIAPPVQAASKPLAVEFTKTQFDEVRAILASKYVHGKLKAPHIWAAASNGAVAALHRKIELLPSSFVALKKFSEGRFSGRTEPLRCQGRTLPGVVVHHIPRPGKGDKPYGHSDPNSTGEPLVDALLSWPPPFSEADFGCVVQWVSGQIVGRSDPVARGSRIKRLPDAVARQRRSEMWLTATRWLLRALDPHSRLTTTQVWADVNAPVDVVTKQDDVTVTPIAGVSGGAHIRLRKFAPGGDQRVRDGLAAIPGGVKAIVLDMRGNRGGILPVAVGLIETFQRGGFVARVKTQDAIAGVTISRRRRRVFDAPMVVLVDEKCASACEFTSAALQDSLRALIVGRRTYGKATLQEYTELKTTKARVMVTVAVFFSPTGHPIQATGVTPDIEVPRKEAAGKGAADPKREEDTPFHLQAETMASFRDVSWWRAAVRRCMKKQAPSGADRDLAYAVLAVACLRDARGAFHATP